MSKKKRRVTGSDKKPFVTAVLSGGAPTCTLMCGALSAIWYGGKTFDAFFTSGAGAIVAMMYLAPRGDMPRGEYMRGILGASIADPIWRTFPLPYKAFYKCGPFNQMMRSWADMFHIPRESGDHHHHHHHHHHGHHHHRRSRHPWSWWASHMSPAGRRLYNDAVDWWAAAMTPTDLNFFSEGLCAPYPFIDDVVDFDKLRNSPTKFLMNAYNITDDTVDQFDNTQADARHFWAAMAYPFVKAPVEIDGKLYYEGSAKDPLNLPYLGQAFDKGGRIGPWVERPRGAKKTVVLMDVLGSLQKCLVRRPRNIIDAYGISVLTPIVSLAILDLKYFKDVQNKPEMFDLHEIKFDIPGPNCPYVSDWSYDNMNLLFNIGFETGKKFVEDHGDLLSDHNEPIPS